MVPIFAMAVPQGFAFARIKELYLAPFGDTVLCISLDIIESIAWKNQRPSTDILATRRRVNKSPMPERKGTTRLEASFLHNEAPWPSVLPTHPK